MTPLKKFNKLFNEHFLQKNYFLQTLFLKERIEYNPFEKITHDMFRDEGELIYENHPLLRFISESGKCKKYYSGPLNH